MNPTPKAFVILGSLLITGWLSATIIASDVDNWADDELSQMHEAGEVTATGVHTTGEVLLVSQETGEVSARQSSTPEPGLFQR